MVKKIIFKLKDKNIKKEEVLDCIWEFLSTLYKNGQILCNYQVIEEQDIYAIVTIPMTDSLDEKYDNVYVKNNRFKIEEIFDISLQDIGCNQESQEYCSCDKTEWILMISHQDDIDSPFVCGYCNKPIALFTLPKIPKEDEYNSIINWQENYRAMDKLFMNCLSDRFTNRQLSDPLAQLSKDGIEIANSLAKAIGKPIYYFLQDKWSSDIRRGSGFFLYENCPLCGNELEKSSNLKVIENICNKCHLAFDGINKGKNNE